MGEAKVLRWVTDEVVLLLGEVRAAFNSHLQWPLQTLGRVLKLVKVTFNVAVVSQVMDEVVLEISKEIGASRMRFKVNRRNSNSKQWAASLSPRMQMLKPFNQAIEHAVP